MKGKSLVPSTGFVPVLYLQPRTQNSKPFEARYSLGKFCESFLGDCGHSVAISPTEVPAIWGSWASRNVVVSHSKGSPI